MSTFAGRLIAVFMLTGVYLLTLGSLAIGDVIIGLALGIVLELGWRRRIARGGWIGSRQVDSEVRRPSLRMALSALPRLTLAVLGEITRGTWEVSMYSLGLRPVEFDGIVEIELEGVSEEGVATWAFITTISPGELVVDIDEERGVLVIHTLDTRDPEKIRTRHHQFYERFQRKVIP